MQQSTVEFDVWNERAPICGGNKEGSELVAAGGSSPEPNLAKKTTRIAKSVKARVIF